MFCFKNNESGEMPCKLDSTENRRSFEKYPTISTSLRGDRKPDGDKKERIPAWTRVATLKEFLCMCTLEVRMLDNASRLSGNLLSAQGNWALDPRPEDPILTESHSSLGVSRACRATPSLLLLVFADQFSENPPFWQTSKCPITTPTPLENDPTPFTKNCWLVPWFSCSTGWGSWIGQCQWKKKSFVHFWRRRSQCSGGLGGARVEAARACWRRLAADQTPMMMVMWWVPKIVGAWCKLFYLAHWVAIKAGPGKLWRQPCVCILQAEQAAPDVW